MIRIGRGAVLADRRARVIAAIEPIVTLDAEAAELTEPECGIVPAMRCNMIGDGRWRDAACLQAKPT